MLTLRECCWKTDTQWDRSHFFGNPQIRAQELQAHPRAIPVPVPTALQLGHCTFQPGKCAAAKLVVFACRLNPHHSLLTPLSWIALHSLLKHCTALLFPTWCISELCCLPVASTLQTHPNSAAWVSPPHPFGPQPLGCGAAFLRDTTVLLLLTCFGAFLPEDLLLSSFLQGILSIHILI